MGTITLPTSPGKKDEVFAIERSDFDVQLMTMRSVSYTSPHYRWVYSFTLPKQKWATARIWAARLNQLAAFDNSFQASPPGYAGPSSGYAGPAPKVKGGSQTGKSLACDGVTLSTAIALEGDYISFNGELHQLSADANSDSSQNVTFALCEMMRSSPANNADVELDAPVATFKLRDAGAAYSADYLTLFDIQVQAYEP